MQKFCIKYSGFDKKVHTYYSYFPSLEDANAHCYLTHGHRAYTSGIKITEI
jgi:hypothetical protein